MKVLLVDSGNTRTPTDTMQRVMLALKDRQVDVLVVGADEVSKSETSNKIGFDTFGNIGVSPRAAGVSAYEPSPCLLIEHPRLDIVKLVREIEQVPLVRWVPPTFQGKFTLGNAPSSTEFVARKRKVYGAPRSRGN